MDRAHISRVGAKPIPARKGVAGGSVSVYWVVQAVTADQTPTDLAGQCEPAAHLSEVDWCPAWRVE
jgi:hypothetical protein